MPPRAVLAPPPPRPRDADHSSQFSRRANVPRRARRASAATPPNKTSHQHGSRNLVNEPLPIENFLADVKPASHRTSPSSSDNSIWRHENDNAEVVSLAFSSSNLDNLENDSHATLTDSSSQLLADNRPLHSFPRTDADFNSRCMPSRSTNIRRNQHESQSSPRETTISELFDAHSDPVDESNTDSVTYRSSAVAAPLQVSEEERRARRRAQRDLIYAYNLQLKELTHKRDLSGCLALMDEMRAKGAKPDAYTYSTVLSCCARLKATETAFQLFGRILAERVRLDEHVIITMMNIAGRANPPNLDLLRALFHQASAPSRVMCNVFIEGLANAGMVDDVEGVLRYMSLRSIAIDSYTSAGLAKAYVRSGEPEIALNRLLELQKTGVLIPPFAFNTVMSGFSNVGDAESARKVFNMLGKRGRTQVSYNVMIAAYSTTNPPDIEKAFDVFNFMLREGRCAGDRYTAHSLMKVSLAAGDGAMALHTYAAMKNNRWMPNQVSYRLAATAAAIQRDGLAVSEIASDVVKNGARLRRDSATMLVVAALRSGELESALKYTLDFVEPKKERHNAREFFKDVREQLKCFNGPVIIAEEGGIYADEVVKDLFSAWRLSASLKK